MAKRVEQKPKKPGAGNKALKLQLSRMALKIGRRIASSEEKVTPKLSAAVGLLNQAQLMVNSEARIARRLLDQARRLANIRE